MLKYIYNEFYVEYENSCYFTTIRPTSNFGQVIVVLCHNLEAKCYL